MEPSGYISTSLFLSCSAIALRDAEKPKVRDKHPSPLKVQEKLRVEPTRTSVTGDKIKTSCEKVKKRIETFTFGQFKSSTPNPTHPPEKKKTVKTSILVANTVKMKSA